MIIIMVTIILMMMTMMNINKFKKEWKLFFTLFFKNILTSIKIYDIVMHVNKNKHIKGGTYI